MEQHLVNMALMRDQAFLPFSAELILMKTLIMSDNYSDVAKKKKNTRQGSHCPEWKKKIAVEIFSLGPAEICEVYLNSPMYKHLMAVFTQLYYRVYLLDNFAHHRTCS